MTKEIEPTVEQRLAERDAFLDTVFSTMGASFAADRIAELVNERFALELDDEELSKLRLEFEDMICEELDEARGTK